MKKYCDKESIKRIIGCIIFLWLAFQLFSNITYLFRNVGGDRNRILGIKNETDIDMIYIGGSAAFVYWQPMRAWKDCGFTSYSLATNTIQAENIKTYMKWAEKYQDPQMYVIGVRAFQYYSDYSTELSEAGLRNGTDCMDITFRARYDTLNNYFENRVIDENTDKVSFYLDIAKYHTNTKNLALSEAWGYLNKEVVCPNKGWEWIKSYEYVDKPSDFYTQSRAELPENDIKILEDLVRYCKELNKNVLFVVCPYAITQEDKSKYNSIQDLIEENGFKFLDTNEYYDEMGIDFSTDFYNEAHVNLFGASKYTQFLEGFICQNYEMPDHRNEEKYVSWNEEAALFFEEEKVYADIVTKLRADYEKDEENR